MKALLASAHLPLDGVDEHFHAFFVAEVAGEIVGAAGLEVHGEHGLLRSVVVAPHAAHRGFGRELIQLVLREAERRGVRCVYLLTTTASAYFAALGFEPTERRLLPASLQASKELQGACPASAIIMRRSVDRSESLRPSSDIDVLVSGGHDGNH